jgi:hypothetical protein
MTASFAKSPGGSLKVNWSGLFFCPVVGGQAARAAIKDRLAMLLNLFYEV